MAARTHTHDSAVAWAREAVSHVSPVQARRAFIRSLGKDRNALPGRAVLAAYAVARHLPKHSFRPTERFSTKYICGVCQFGATHGDKMPLDLEAIDEQMTEWGMVPFMEEPAPLAYVLETAARHGDSEPAPGEIETLRGIVGALESVVGAAREANDPKRLFRKEALDAIGKAFRSNKYVRAWILGTLGYCGILRVPGKLGFWRAFVPLDDRPDPPERNNELSYPTSFWRPADGIDRERLFEVFPELK